MLSFGFVLLQILQKISPKHVLINGPDDSIHMSQIICFSVAWFYHFLMICHVS